MVGRSRIAALIILAMLGAGLAPTADLPADAAEVPGAAPSVSSIRQLLTMPLLPRADGHLPRVLVRWEEGVEASARQLVLTRWAETLNLDSRFEVDAVVAVTSRVDAVELAGFDEPALQAAARTLVRDPAVALVEVDRVVEVRSASSPLRLAPVPDDPLFSLQWGLRNTGQRFESSLGPVVGEAGVDVRALEAWAETRGSAQIRVAVIDTAINTSHPDLADAVVLELSAGAVGSRLPGVHGTAVSGVIAARADDGVGVAGLAPEISIVSIAAFDELAGSGSTTTIGSILEAFEIAAGTGAVAINASWVTSDPSALLLAAVADAGVPVIAASGNEGAVLTPQAARYPAGFDLPNLLAVTAVDPRGLVPSFANTGDGVVDIAAPGSFIAAPSLGEGHVWAEGTSFAAPFVTAAIALAVDVAPYASVDEVIDAVVWTSRPLPSLHRTTRTGGMLDAGALVRGIQRPVCRPDRLEPPDFPDVAATSVHASGIACVSLNGIAQGRADGSFDPAGPVTRAQLASFLARILVLAGVDPDDPQLPLPGLGPDEPLEPELPETPDTPDVPDITDGSDAPDVSDSPGASDTSDTSDTSDASDAEALQRTSLDLPFLDVDPDDVHAEAIALLAQLGIVEGDGDGAFRPNETVTRGQMATVLTRAHQALLGVEREPSRRWFVDTTLDVHADAADIARDLGIVRGVTRDRFQPGAPTQRAQMASFLARALDALVREGVVLG